MLARVTTPPGRPVAEVAEVAAEVATELVRHAPEHGPSAAAVGIGGPGRDDVVVTRGHARTLDRSGRPSLPAPLSCEPVFDVGSVTKVAVTTALCMRLVDAGRLSLDAPVHGPGTASVTVRDLLEHRGGLWEWWPTYLAGARTATEALSVVRSLPLRYPPRSARHYSDLGFMLLGELVAREYAEPLDVVADRELFAPLGMCSTGFRRRGAGTSTDGVVATSLGDWYERRMVATGSPYPVRAAGLVEGEPSGGWREDVLLGEANDGNCWHAFGGVAGHAGLFTTVPDLLRLGRALLASLDGTGPWSAPVVEEFFRAGRDPAQALGFRITPDGSVGHPGFPGAWFAVLPERRRVVVLLTNRLHTTDEPPTVEAARAGLMHAAGS